MANLSIHLFVRSFIHLIDDNNNNKQENEVIIKNSSFTFLPHQNGYLDNYGTLPNGIFIMSLSALQYRYGYDTQVKVSVLHKCYCLPRAIVDLFVRHLNLRSCIIKR